MTPIHHGPPKHRSRNVRGKLLAIATTSAIVLGGAGLAVVAAGPANAATQHAGSYSETFGGFLGNAVTPTGAYIYCDQPAGGDLTGSTTDLGVSSSFSGDRGAVSADGVQHINYVLTKYGATDDPVQAAAVALYVYSYVGRAGAAFPQGSEQAGLTYLAAGHADIQAEADTIFNDANANYNSGATSGGTGSLVFNVDQSNNYVGTVTVNAPAGWVGSITLTNGVFVDSGTASLAGVSAGAVLKVKGVPPTPGAQYEISGQALGQTPGGGAVNSDVHLWNNGGGQGGVSSGTRQQAPRVGISGHDPEQRSSNFSPAANTQTDAAFYKAGDTPVDHVIPQLAKNADGTTNQWPVADSGNYAPVKIDATLYGPLPAKPVQGAAVPAGTPVVGHGTVTVGGTPANPVGQDVKITSDTSIGADQTKASGYYVWVESINGSEQIPAVQPWFNNGANFAYQTDYGIATESTIVAPNVTTQSSTTTGVTTPIAGANVPTTGLGLPVNDTVVVAGNVTADEGLTVIDRHYTFPATTDSIGNLTVPAATTCDASTLDFTSSPITIDHAGNYPATFDSTKVGVGTWVETLLGPKGEVVSQGSCTDHAEWTGVKQLLVTTKASSNSNGTATDTATIWGTVPAGAQLSSTLYNQAGAQASADDVAVATAGPVGLAQGLANATVVTLPTVNYPSSMKAGYFVESVFDVHGNILDQAARGVSAESILAGAGGNGNGANAAAASLPVISG